jgi:hypothetical protein
MRVKDVAVMYYGPSDLGPTARQTGGTADVDGTTETYQADVADDGEPGSGVDRFRLRLNGAPVADDYLAGGNIQLHKPQCQ